MSWTPHHNEVVYKDSLESIVDAIGGTGIVSGMAVTPGSSGSYTITIASGSFKLEGTEYSYAGQTNYSLSSYIPATANYYRYVTVGIIRVGGVNVVSVLTSTQASQISDLVMDYTSSTQAIAHVATIQLRNGQTTIDSAEIVDSPRMLIAQEIDLANDVTGILPSANMDADTAHLSGTQTFTGSKTFTAAPTITQTGVTNGERGLLLQNSLATDGPTWIEFREATGGSNGPVAQIGLAESSDISPRLFLGMEQTASLFSSSRVTNANRGLHIFDNGAILATGGVGEGSITNDTVVYDMNLTTFADGAQPTWAVPSVSDYPTYNKTTNGVEVDTTIVQNNDYRDNGNDAQIPNMRINNDGKSLKVNRTNFDTNMRAVLGAPKSYNFNITFDMYIENKTNALRGGSITVQAYMVNRTNSGDVKRLNICYVAIYGYDLIVYGSNAASPSQSIQSSGSSTSSFNSEIAEEWIRVRIDVEAHAATQYANDSGVFKAALNKTSGTAPIVYNATYGTSQLWGSSSVILEDYELMTHMPIELVFASNNTTTAAYQDTFYIDNLSIQTKEGYDLP